MYTLYHIPNRKEWGCTNNLNGRLQKLGYSILDVDKIIEVNDIDGAAEMEKQLNLEYGYGWNESQDYRRVTKMGLKGAIIGSKIRIGGKCFTPLKPVLVYDAKTNIFLGEYKSQKEASVKLNIPTSNITDVVKGRRKTVKGYKIKYKV
jgi:hypothetical protein